MHGTGREAGHNSRDGAGNVAAHDTANWPSMALGMGPRLSTGHRTGYEVGMRLGMCIGLGLWEIFPNK